MFLQDVLKQLVIAGVAIAASAALWRQFVNEYTAKVAEQIKKQKPIEFKAVEFKPMKFDSKSLIWNQPSINLGGIPAQSSSPRPGRSR